MVELVPGKTDKELAADFRRRMLELYAPVMALVDEADAAGLQLSFGSVKGPLGKQVINSLTVVKVL
jgi:hypothetical protein